MDKKPWVFFVGILFLVTIIFFFLTRTPKPNDQPPPTAPDDSKAIIVHVLSWNPQTAILAVTTENKAIVPILIDVTKTTVVIPVTKPGEPRSETLLLVKKAGNQLWELAFCVDDEIQIYDESVDITKADTATPLAAVAKFSARGKGLGKKDLGLMAMSYGYVFVANVAMGANDQQTLKALIEAEAYDGPSLIIAYSHCIAHGIDMAKGLEQQKLLAQTGLWPLYRYNPNLVNEGKNPLQLDGKEPSIAVKDYAYNETRYRMLVQSDEARAEMLMEEAGQFAQRKWELYKQMAAMAYTKPADSVECG